MNALWLLRVRQGQGRPSILCVVLRKVYGVSPQLLGAEDAVLPRKHHSRYPWSPKYTLQRVDFVTTKLPTSTTPFDFSLTQLRHCWTCSYHSATQGHGDQGLLQSLVVGEERMLWPLR